MVLNLDMLDALTLRQLQHFVQVIGLGAGQDQADNPSAHVSWPGLVIGSGEQCRMLFGATPLCWAYLDGWLSCKAWLWASMPANQSQFSAHVRACLGGSTCLAVCRFTSCWGLCGYLVDSPTGVGAGIRGYRAPGWKRSKHDQSRDNAEGEAGKAIAGAEANSAYTESAASQDDKAGVKTGSKPPAKPPLPPRLDSMRSPSLGAH